MDMDMMGGRQPGTLGTYLLKARHRHEDEHLRLTGVE